MIKCVNNKVVEISWKYHNFNIQYYLLAGIQSYVQKDSDISKSSAIVHILSRYKSIITI